MEIKNKCIAELTTWTGEKVVQEIKREWAESIAEAVSGQFYFADKVSGFAINGGNFSNVNVYEVNGV